MLRVLAIGYSGAVALSVVLAFMTELPIWSLALIFWFGGAVLTLAVGLIVHMMSSTSDQRDSYASVINARWGAYRRHKAATDGESKSIF